MGVIASAFDPRAGEGDAVGHEPSSTGVRHGFVMSGGLRLHYAAAGDPGAPLLLLAHGFPDFWYGWRHQLTALAATHHVVALDLRGFNLSDTPDGDADYRVGLIIRDLLAVADHFGAVRFVLAGHDWGGVSAWALALRHPDRLERLIVLNAPHPWIMQKRLLEERGQRVASAYIKMFRQADAAARIMQDGGGALFDAWMGDLVASGGVSPADRDLYLGAWRRPGAMHAMLGCYRCSPITVPEPDGPAPPIDWLARPFASLAVPASVIWGVRDRLLLPGLLDDLDRLVPDLTIDRIEAGHFLMQEAPKR